MSTSDPIAPDRLEALLRGEAGADGRERRIGALLDELHRRRDLAARGAARARPLAHDRAGRAAPSPASPAAACACAGRGASRPRSARRGRGRDRGRRRDADADVADTARGAAHLAAADQHVAARPRLARTARSPRASAQSTPAARRPRPTARRPRPRCPTVSAHRTTPPRCGSRSAAWPSSRARPRACSTPCARSAAQSRRSTTARRARAAAARLIDLRVPVGRAQEALRRFSALGTITAQQVQIRDLQAGLDQETNRVRARCATASTLLKAKLLSPSLTDVERVTLESRLADSQSVARKRPARRPRAPAARRVRALLARRS